MLGTMKQEHQTTVGAIQDEVLAYTAGRDVVLDQALIEVDCIGSAAHVTMLSEMSIEPPLFGSEDVKSIIAALGEIMQAAQKGAFEITLADQDVHLAVERALTEKLGDLGKKVHTARSRNDQVAVDLRLFAKTELLDTIKDIAALGQALQAFAAKHERVPMVGRTHMQPGMPSSVGLWACSYADALLEDVALVQTAYRLNDQSPLGAAASYGVPLPIDRHRVAELLGFEKPIHSVLHANNARGKLESIILSALSQVMLTLSRLAQDLMLFTMPEFGYFTLPAEYCTGSSIMPQKRNPDVLELIRSRATKVMAASVAIFDIVKGAPSGYNRDLQDAKEYFMDGLSTTRTSVRIMALMVEGLEVNEEALLKGFSPDVFATDRALQLVGEGMTFRDAYHHVKEHLDELESMDPQEAVNAKTHYGATAGLDLDGVASAYAVLLEQTNAARQAHDETVSSLIGQPYPFVDASAQ